MTPMSKARPVLVYDGDCGFCRRWVLRWRALTAGRADFVAFQDAASRWRDIPRARFTEAVCLVEGPRRSWGAQAVFRLLSLAPRRGWLLALYEGFPPFALASEAVYRLVARNRVTASRITRWLYGEDLEPPTYFASTRLLIAALALCYLAAFWSLAVQVDGLLGSNGILPAAQLMEAARRELGDGARWALPSLAWAWSSDAALRAFCWTGTGLSVLLLAGLAPGPILLALWALYLSLVNVGQDFLSFQWDVLLLEAGLLAVFLAPWTWRASRSRKPPEPAFVWLMRWLLFRLMLESGAVKLLSGDPTWRNLTALYYHYQTQPLPPWTAWYFQHLPAWFQRFSCASVFVVELGAPWLVLMPRRPRALAAMAFLSLQALIALTGNYCFFNILAAALCLPLLDDAFWARNFPRLARRLVPPDPEADRPGWRAWAAVPALALCVGLGLLQLGTMLGGSRLGPGLLSSVAGAVEPFHAVNGYGLFAVMTTTRHEIVIEGSDDGRTWREYEFAWKPGAVDRRPRFVAPHQPRLDWQMWFAALGPYQQSPWFTHLLVRLLQGSPETLALLARDPFAGKPPFFLRAQLYEYRFTSSQQRAATGAWWTRESKGLYCPVASLRRRQD
jgi:predicted DCC family thiol-disulfide oxidoreductase YuxK